MIRLRKPLIILVVLGTAVAATAMVMKSGGGDDENKTPFVTVTRGSLVDKALAVGTIEPRVEIDVKSQVPGVVKKRFADVGDFVQAGSPLFEVQPNPTPQELMEAGRQIDVREIELKSRQIEYDRQKQLFEKQLISAQEFDKIRESHEEAVLGVQMAKDALGLLKTGRIATSRGQFETVVRAPVSGFILDKMVEVGDPIVPLTSYQEGTVLMTMADMKDLIFRGTVDEIDVGRLVEGMPVELKIGALANARVKGRLSKIWLKARKEENSTVFPVEIEITEAVEKDPKNGDNAERPAILRAGYSSNAEIIIEKRDNVLIIPERVVEMAGDTSRVTLLLADNKEEKRVIQTGLSDAVNIEVVSGLQAGVKVKEKPQKEIQ